MRVTADTKAKTRGRILAAGRKLFAEKGFDGTTTRDLAHLARVASGTLFNYFPSKESLAVQILTEAMDRGRATFDSRRYETDSIEEEMFALVAAEIREMGPYRSIVGPVVETAMSPLGVEGEAIRSRHLEAVAEIIHRRHGHGAATSVNLHLYWSLYLGVLAFWARDESPNQGDSLVLLDQATRLFAASLGRWAEEGEES
jgi:AcrR family transcriptional regulator